MLSRLYALLSHVVLATLVSGTAMGADETDPVIPSHLAWKDAVRIFRERGFDLLLADAAVENARGDQLLAGVVANPSFSAGVGRSFAYGDLPGGGALGWSFGVSDSSAIFDILSGKRGLRAATAKIALDKAKQDRVDAERVMLGVVGQAYLDVVFTKQALGTQKEAQETLGKLTTLNSEKYHHGAISEVEVLKVETEKLSIDQEVDKAEQDLATNKAQLAYLLGIRKPGAQFDVDGELPKYGLPGFLAGTNQANLLKRAWEGRPDLVGARLAREKAEASIKSSQRLRFPDVALSAGVSGQGSGTDSVNPPTFSVGVSVTPPLLNAFAGEITKAKADALAARAAEGKLESQVLSEVYSAHSQWGQSRKRVERAQSGLLDRAGRTRDLVRLQYQKGSASLLEYLDAERIFIATQLSYITDLADYWRAVVSLSQAIGEDFIP